MSDSTSRRRPHVFPVRLSDDELATIRAHAEESGMTVAAYMREKSLKKPTRQRNADKIVTALSKIGTNINQLAKQANAGRFPTKEILEEALAELTEIARSI
jgi:hypothetical protein